jgi:hypothetical protein
MNGLPIPPELDQPVPRRVKTNIWFKLMAVLLLIFPGAGLLMLAVIYGAFHEKAMLKANGVPITAQITDLHIESGASKYYFARYRFQALAMPDGQPHIQSGEGQVSESQYHSLQVGQAVPVLYDPAHPANSGINIDDSLHKSDPYATMPLLMTTVVGLFGGVFALLMAGLLFLYFREKKFVQWGRFAPAILLKEEEIGGLHPRMTATYQFTDAQGRTLVCVQKNLPSVKKLDWPGFREFRRNVTENPIVLYDPQNSEKNMLYRAGFLTAVLP